MCGCQAWYAPPTVQGIGGHRSILRPQSELYADAATLEIFIIRCPADTSFSGELWQDIDEQVFSPALRYRLAANGFRAGVVGNQIPHSLIKLMDIKDDTVTDNGVATIRLDEMSNTPRVMRANVFSRNRERHEIATSNIKEEATVLYYENDTPGGEMYRNVQGVFGMMTEHQGDGRVKVTLIPELQHGEMRQQYTHNVGATMVVMAKPKKTFDSLRCEATLGPGQILVITNVEDQTGNLGDFFLKDDESDMRHRKIICVRLCQSPYHDMFSPDGRLPLDVLPENNHPDDSEESWLKRDVRIEGTKVTRATVRTSE